MIIGLWFNQHDIHYNDQSSYRNYNSPMQQIPIPSWSLQHTGYTQSTLLICLTTAGKTCRYTQYKLQILQNHCSGLEDCRVNQLESTADFTLSWIPDALLLPPFPWFVRVRQRPQTNLICFCLILPLKIYVCQELVFMLEENVQSMVFSQANLSYLVLDNALLTLASSGRWS